eukprot:3962629-Prymnesium_polylepis.1
MVEVSKISLAVTLRPPPPPHEDGQGTVVPQSTMEHPEMLTNAPPCTQSAPPPPPARLFSSSPSMNTAVVQPEMFVSVRCTLPPSTKMAPPESAVHPEMVPPVMLKRLLSPNTETAPPLSDRTGSGGSSGVRPCSRRAAPEVQNPTRPFTNLTLCNTACPPFRTSRIRVRPPASRRAPRLLSVRLIPSTRSGTEIEMVAPVTVPGANGGSGGKGGGGGEDGTGGNGGGGGEPGGGPGGCAGDSGTGTVGGVP